VVQLDASLPHCPLEERSPAGLVRAVGDLRRRATTCSAQGGEKVWLKLCVTHGLTGRQSTVHSAAALRRVAGACGCMYLLQPRLFCVRRAGLRLGHSHGIAPRLFLSLGGDARLRPTHMVRRATLIGHHGEDIFQWLE
jgi:hypothetical protein